MHDLPARANALPSAVGTVYPWVMVRMAGARLWAASLVLVVGVGVGAVGALVPACGSDSESTAGVGGGATSLDGLVALSVSPPTAQLEIAWGETATQPFVATGSFADGSSGDVTSLVHWSTTLWQADVTLGLLSVTLPGTGTVTAEGLGLTASATVEVKLHGDVLLPGTPSGTGDALGGTPQAASKPGIVYPLDQSLFPFNLGNTEFHVVQGDPSQSVGRIDVTGDLIDLHIVGLCAPIPSAANGCAMALDDTLVPSLAGASEGDAMSVRVRLAAPDGSALGESDGIDVRWTFTEVRGGLYFWSARDNGATHVFRYDLDQQGTPPESFFSNLDSPPLHDGTQQPCVGCHAVSQDGTKIALTFGGSDPSDFELVDVSTKAAIAVRNTDPAGFATFSALSPDAAYIVSSFRGALTLRSADQTLGTIATLAPAETAGEALTQPFWSADGSALAYVGWQPGQNGASASTNGDIEQGGQIFVSEISGTTLGATRLLVPRVAERTSYYPAISDDGAFVVFNQSRCDGPVGVHGYGPGPCDGYDDASAQVFVVPLAGGTPVTLGRLNGDDTWTNSWPRWSPTHGTFKGKPIYFIAFSTKRPYGLRLPGSNLGATPPQLWLAAVSLDPAVVPGPGDASFAPVWLPLQDEDMANPTGNHVPQWAAKAMPIPR